MARSTPTDTVFAAFYVILVVVWSLAIPFDGAPDEATHAYLVEFLYKYGYVPTPNVDPVVQFQGALTGRTVSNEDFWYFGLPYLHSLGASVLSHAFKGLVAPEYGYLLPRSFNWLMAFLFASSIVSIGRRCGLRGALAFLIPAVILLIPQVTFIFAYFNADAFALSCTALALHLMLSAIDRPTIGRALVFGAGCGLVLCSKIYYYPALVFFAALIAFERVIDRGFPLSRFGLAAMTGAILVAGPVLVATFVQFGEFTGLRGQVIFTEMHASPELRRCYFLCGEKLIDFREVYFWLGTAFKTFFFGLGWMSIYLPNIAYILFFAPLVLAFFVVGLLAALRSATDGTGQGPARLGLMLSFGLFWGMAISVVTLSLVGSQRLLPQAQGRYLFVVIPFAFFLLASIGSGRTVPALHAGFPPRRA